jgi:DNA-binding Lrp family transcriptional regulator
MPAKAIDALLMHGALTQTQLRIHVGCAAGSISDLVYRLNKAGIINKNGGKISLKEL